MLHHCAATGKGVVFLQGQGRSAPGGVHEAHYLGLVVVAEVVALGLDGHGLADSGPQRGVVVGMAAQDGAQVDGVLIAQAEQQSALDREPDPVAQMAEVVAVGGNEADADGAVRHARIAGGAATGLGGGQQRPPAGDALAQLVAGTAGLGAVVASGGERGWIRWGGATLEQEAWARVWLSMWPRGSSSMKEMSSRWRRAKATRSSTSSSWWPRRMTLLISMRSKPA